MKKAFALLSLAAVVLTGCATAPEDTSPQATPSQTAKSRDYDDTITGSRLPPPRRTTQQ